MASKFVLTAQLQLQAPTNVRQVVSLVNRQLQGVQMNVNPVVNTKALAQANSAVQKISVSAKGASKSLTSAAGSANSLGAALGSAARRFASITLATGFFLALTRALGSAVGRAVEFEKEMLKISQVTGKSVRDLSNLSKEVTRLASNLGVGSDEILNAARSLSQAGFSAQKVTGALKTLAQTDLAATFDNIADTTEGAIAILSQFRKEVRAAGGEVAFLEKAMDSINSVSKSFAVESADLISVVRRTGGVFEAAGGSLNELIALFTSVRSTTRETADTIATGFRTIFTRIQRTETIDQLKELGIVLQDSTGKFVGPLEAIQRLSAGLKALDPRDFRFNQIVEQLGGFRQIGKVIPLIKKYQISTEALAVANNSMGSTAKDAAIAQQGLGNQFAQLKEKFDATIRSLSDSETFKTLATSAIKMAEAILRIVDALEPLLPMLTALAAFKLGQIAIPAFGKFSGISGANAGGKIHGFAGGGMVPGRGNRDTVPAMLQPGEFVMRKSAVNKIGADNMANMNNGYAAGGTVTARRSNYGDGVRVRLPKKAERDQIQKNNAAGVSTKKVTDEATDEVMDVAKLKAAMKALKVDYRLGGPKGKSQRPGGFSLDKTTVKSRFGDAGTKNVGTATDLGVIPYTKMIGKDWMKVKNHVLQKFPGTDPVDISKAKQGISTNATLQAPQVYPIASIQDEAVRKSIDDEIRKVAAKKLKEAVPRAVKAAMKDPEISKLATAMGLKMNEGDWKSGGVNVSKDKQAITSMSGFIFEGVINAMSGAGLAGGDASFDISRSELSANRGGLSKMFGARVNEMKMAEVKTSKSKLDQIPSKLKTFVKGESSVGQSNAGISIAAIDGKATGLARGGRIQGFAEGGSAGGTDTVSAMLTPGEFVLKKSAAQGIGYSNLHRMNQSNGVNGYAAGGIVTGTRGNYGTMPGGGASIGTIPGIESVSKGFTQLAKSIGDLVGQLIRAGTAVATGSTTAAERLVQGAGLLGTALTESATGITPVDNILREAVTTSAGVLTTAFTEASAGVRMVDDILLEAVTTSVSSLREGMVNASAGISTVDDILRAQVSASVGALTEGMVNASTGISTVDDILKAAVVTAVASLEAAMVDASAGIRKVDDILLQGIQGALAPLKNAMVAFSQGLIESDGVLATGIAAMTDLPKTVELFQGEMVKVTTIFTAMEGAMADLPAQIEKFGLTLVGMSGVNTSAMGAQGASNVATVNNTLTTQAATTTTAKTTAVVQTSGNAKLKSIAWEKIHHKNMMTALATDAKSQTATMTKVSAVQQHKTAIIKAVQAQGGLDALSPAVQTSLKKYMAALNKRSIQLETQAAAPMGMMAGAGAKVSGVGKGMQAAGAGVMSGGMGQGMMMAGMMMPMVTQMMGMEGPMADAITQFGMLAAMLPMVLGSFTEMIGSVVASVGAKITEVAASKASAAAEFAEAGASGVSGVADTGEAGASGVAAAADTAEAGASSLAAASIGLFALAIAGVIAVMMYFKAVAKEAADEASDMAEGIKSGKENFSLQDIQGKRLEAIGAEDKAGNALKLGLSGAAIGAAVGSVVPVIGTAIGAGVGAIIGAGIGVASAVWGTSAREAMDPVAMASNELAKAQYYGAVAQRDYANSQKEAMMLELKGVDLARHQIKASQQLGRDGQKAADAMKKFRDIQMITGELSEGEMTDTQKESLEDSEKGLRELTKVYFQAANDSKAALSSLTEEMFEGGKSLNEIMGSVEVQGLLNDVFAKAKTGFSAQLAAEGFGIESAMGELGFDAGTDLSQDTATGLRNSAQLEALVIQKQQNEANKRATETTKAQRKAIFDEGKARHEAMIAARIELNAKLALAAQARAAAKALAALDGALLSAQQATANMAGSIGAANGQFKEVKRNITGFLKSDDKATRQQGFTAAGAMLGPAGAAQAQGVSNKLDKLDKMDQILRTQGLKEFTGGTDMLGRQAQSFEELDKFLLGFGIDIGNAAPAIQAKITTMMEDGLDPDEINQIMEMFKGPIEAQRDRIIKLVKIQEEYNKQYGMASDALIKAKQAEIKGNVKLSKIFAKGQERLAEAQGTPLTTTQKQTNRVRAQQAGLQGTGVRAGDTRGAQQAIARNRAEMRANAERLQATNLSSQEMNTLTMRQKELAASSEQVTGHLEELADQSARAADIMGDIEKERSAREAVQDKAKQFTFAGNEERQKMNMNLKALQRVLQTGTLASIPEEFRSAVGALLNDFKDVKITRTGMTGGQVSKQLQIQALDRNARQVRGRGLTAEEIKNIFESTTKEDKLIDDLRALNKEEVAAQQVLNRILQANTQESGKLLTKISALITAIQATLPPGGAGPMHGGLIQGFAEGGTTKAARYRSSPKNMFKPRGTDTVPAMLTPGEFVMQKSAVDSIGAANLSAMNEGKPIYRAAGGFVAKKGPVVGSGIQNLLKGFIAKGINDSGLESLARAYNWVGGKQAPTEEQQLSAKQFIVDLPNNVDANFPILINAVSKLGELDSMRTAESVMLANPWGESFAEAGKILRSAVNPPDNLKQAVNNLGLFSPRVMGAWTGANKQEYIGEGNKTFGITGTDAGIATGMALYTGGALKNKIGATRSSMTRLVSRDQVHQLMNTAEGNLGKWSMPGSYANYKKSFDRRYPTVVERYKTAYPREGAKAAAIDGYFDTTSGRLGLNIKAFDRSKVVGAGKSSVSSLGEAIQTQPGGPGARALGVITNILEAQKALFDGGASKKEKSLIAMFDPMGAVHVQEVRNFMSLAVDKMTRRGVSSGYFTRNFSPSSYEVAGGSSSQKVAQMMGIDLPPWRIFRGVIGQPADLGAAGIDRDQMGDFKDNIFRAAGGPVGANWKSRGTDTVPAMLTPGEFVMKKSAVDKYGMGFMSAINGGNAFSGGGYMAEGGSVSQFGPPPDSQGISELTKKSEKSSLKLIAGQTSLIGAQHETIAGVSKVELGVGNIGQEMLSQGAASLNFRDYLQFGLRDVFPDSFATGGPVGVNWQPKGTDTVPAMLTPGEFVMKKSAVDKYGMGFMSAINSGVQHFKGGGLIKGEDDESLAKHQKEELRLHNLTRDAEVRQQMNELRAQWDLETDPVLLDIKAVEAENEEMEYRLKWLLSAPFGPDMFSPGDKVFNSPSLLNQDRMWDSGRNRQLPDSEWPQVKGLREKMRQFETSAFIPLRPRLSPKEVKGFAAGGPVLPPNQWESQTGEAVNVNSIMNQIRAGTGADYGMDTLPAIQSSLYKGIANTFGRGVWGTLTNSGGYNDLLAPHWSPIESTLQNLSRQNAKGSALMVGQGKHGGGSIRAWSISRLGDLSGVNVGGYNASIPNFGVSGPFDFNDSGAFGWDDPANTPLVKMTGVAFARAWMPYALGNSLPGGSGGGTLTNRGITFGGLTRKKANMALGQAIKNKQWDPLTGGNLVKRIQAGWIFGIPDWAQDATKKAFPDPAFGARHQDVMLKSPTIGTQNQHYFASGGAARGTDTVPAMLTPGEFVMKKSAVDKYGVGVMSAINNGVQRFATGGPVQYLKNGSNKPVAAGSGTGIFAAIPDIVSSISESLSAFTTAFNLFSGLSNLLSNTINSMAEMNITHTININGSVNIPGFSKRAVKKIINAVVEEVVDDVDAKINQALAERDRNNENKT